MHEGGKDVLVKKWVFFCMGKNLRQKEKRSPIPAKKRKGGKEIFRKGGGERSQPKKQLPLESQPECRKRWQK